MIDHETAQRRRLRVRGRRACNGCAAHSTAASRGHAEELFDRLLEDRTVRVAVIAIWWWLGWHFLAGDTL
ncbi:DUF6186 family protein [Leucobacter salsicius]|uniref:DUF6186 family protein n=1 Tax=Leucobacter salsicius TaxID=664638 RepID=UPI0038BC990D